MPKFLIEASYTLEGVKGLRSAGGTQPPRCDRPRPRDRRRHRSSTSPSPSATRTSSVIVDLPDNTAAAAVALTVNSAGGASTKMTPLISAEEVDAAAKRSVEYRPPGS